MNKDVIRVLVQLVPALIIALLIWNYYRHRTFTVADRYSTFGPRFWTGSVHSCVLWPLTFVITVLFTLDLPRGLAAVLVVVENLAWLLYTVMMHARYGQTVGKMVTKVRVVDFRTEGKISVGQAWLREGIPMVLSLGFLAWQVTLIFKEDVSPQTLANGEGVVGKLFWWGMMLPLLWFIAEVLTMLTNEKRRALHDFIAGTVVVRTNVESSVGSQDGNALTVNPPFPTDPRPQ